MNLLANIFFGLSISELKILVSFREKAMRIFALRFLSKCCFLVLLLITTSGYAQHVIKVKKAHTDTVVDKTPIGFYYSDAYALGNGKPGEPPTDFVRLYLVIDKYKQVQVFQSSQSVKVAFKKFLKNPSKSLEEQGKISFANNDIYIVTKQTIANYATYRYVGKVIDRSTFYISYKAQQYAKRALNIYLHQYVK